MAASAALYHAAFPPFNLSLLVFVALAPWIASLKAASGWGAFRSGYLFGLLFWLGQFHWGRRMAESGGQFIARMEIQETSDVLLPIERYGLGLDYLEDYRKAVAAVTPQDVQAMARKYIDPKRMVLVAAGALDKAGKPIQKLPLPKR